MIGLGTLAPAQVDAYLDRLGMPAPASLSVGTLSRLLDAHLLSVPFENLDVLMGVPISVEVPEQFSKIVERRRGGYCFEVNLLFGALLDALGFQVRPATARVWYRTPPTTPPPTHVVNIVRVQNKAYIVDAGFGGTTPRVPVPLAAGVTKDKDGPIHLTPHPDWGWMLSRENDAGLMDQFSLTGENAFASDMVMGNHFTSTHPSSHFLSGLRVGLFTPHGRDSILDQTATVRLDGEAQQVPLASPDAAIELLSGQFGLDVGPAQHSRLRDALAARWNAS